MWEIVRAGGPFMWPIIICSIALVGIVLERLWTLQRKRVLPQELIKKVSELAERNQVNPKVIEALEKNSPLGRVLAAALANRHRGRDIMMERVEDVGRHVVHELERFVNSRGHHRQHLALVRAARHRHRHHPRVQCGDARRHG